MIGRKVCRKKSKKEGTHDRHRRSVKLNIGTLV
jgi:hypothetical protein